ncbi:MAG: hypothetical protein ACLP5J_23340, partial [Mycobacterium sp.]|uniref:hypothetical protein n=1 Tax=Mycobacterium sp. TaxID=1785 RepID=UPI003F9EA738
RILPRHIKVRVLCAVCGEQAASVELLPPGLWPGFVDDLPVKIREFYAKERKEKPWWLRYEGVAAGNGSGNPIGEDEAERIAVGFAEPLSYARVHDAGFYDDAGFCGQCGKPYCYQHWNTSPGEYGHCPMGHGKSLDPHWSPDDYD